MASLPSAVPYPTAKPNLVESRIAQAFGGSARDAVLAAANKGSSGDSVRAAILQALSEEPRANPAQPPVPTMKAMSGTEPQRPASMPKTSVPSSLVASRSPLDIWDVQIAATPSQATARQILSEVQARLAVSVLGASQPVAQELRDEGRILYRARFTGFASKASADTACGAIKRVAYTCYTVAATN